MSTFNKGYCLNHVPGLAVVDDRCIGFAKSLAELGIEYGGEVAVPEDNIARHNTLVEMAVDDSGDWDGIGLLLTGATQLPAGLKLKKNHPGMVMGSFDTSTLLYEALESGNVLFGIDQQPYLQGYLPIPILTHVATTKQHFLDHAIESGPSFVISTPSSNEAACVSANYPVCPQLPEENYNYVTEGLIVLGIVFFAIQACASVSAIGWMIYYRKAVVIKVSQPEFLVLVAVGCLMLCSAILPLSVQGEYRYERDSITIDETDTFNEDIQVSESKLYHCRFILISPD